jgi:hypothetical protein
MIIHSSKIVSVAGGVLVLLSMGRALAAQPVPVPPAPPAPAAVDVFVVPPHPPIAPEPPLPPDGPMPALAEPHDWLMRAVPFAVPPMPPLPPLPEMPATAPMPPMPPVAVWPDVDLDFKIEVPFALDLQSGRGAAAPAPPPMPATATARVAPRVMTEDRVENLYRQARSLIDSNRYERAITQLRELSAMSDASSRADAALYWTAYAQAKIAARTEALATLADMQKRFAKSAWIDAARALEVEIKQASGQSVSPDMLASEDLKLLALRGLMQSDPERALPMVEQLLSGNSSVRVKENALFVVSQSRAPRARDIIAGAARSGSNPDVQLTAIRYLGAMRGTDNQELFDEIYRSTTDEAVKRAVIEALFRSQNATKLVGIAKSEKDLPRKRTVVRYLGSLGAERSGEMLKDLYRTEPQEIKRDVINALAAQRNAAALVELARAEKDQALKKDLVTRLSTMRSKEATDYLLELLK